MDSNDLTRRQILSGTATALGGITLAGNALADVWTRDRPGPKRYNVGIESPAAQRAVETAATDVAVIDTGIDSDHPDLATNLGEGKAVVSCTDSEGDCNEPWDDDNGHGTHCAGTVGAADDGDGVVGVSTDATLHAVKVLDYRGYGAFSDVARGIRWVADQGYDVASMSLGGWKTKVVEDAVEYAYDKGVLLVAAAGNAGPCSSCVGYPAGEPEVIAVSATSEDDSLAWFSSTGPEVDIAAPGQGIYSTYPSGYETLSGTSMACPHVSGAAAQLMDNGHTHVEARDALESSAEDLGLDADEQGYGLLDVAAALSFDSSDSSADPAGVDTTDPVVESVQLAGGDGPTGVDVEVDWSVADDGDNLESVDLNLYELDVTGLVEETSDTASVAVSGTRVSGTTVLSADGPSTNGFEVELVVADGAGNLGAKTVEWGGDR